MTYKLRDTVVNRHENLNYAKWGDMEKPVLAGTGITDWTEDASPNTDDGQYINEKNQHSNMTGYAPSVSYSGELIPGNEFVLHVYEVGKRKLLGEMFTAYEVETWAPVEGAAGEYSCHLSKYEIQPSNPGSGEGGGKIALEGTFAQKGDSLHGKYNIATGVFTEGSYNYTTGVFTPLNPEPAPKPEPDPTPENPDANPDGGSGDQTNPDQGNGEQTPAEDPAVEVK